MRRRTWLWIGGGLAVGLGVMALIPGFRYQVRGYLNDEPFARGHPLSYWIAQMKKSNLQVTEASEALLEIGPPAVPDLLSLVDNPIADTRYAGARVLERIGVDAAPILLKILKEGKDQSRQNAAYFLGHGCGTPSTAVPGLIAALKDPSAGVRSTAATSLAEFGVLAQEAVPALKETLQDTDSGVTNAVRNALDVITGKRPKRQVGQ